MAEAQKIDQHKLEQAAGNLFGHVEGAFSIALAFLGDRLGLYRVLALLGPSTSSELAQQAGLKERWVLEWLRQQTAARILTHAGGRFELTAEAAELFSREESPFFAGGVFGAVIGLLETLDDVEDSFRTGIGGTYDTLGKTFAAGLERMFAPFFRTLLVPQVLPRLDGLVEKLEQGARVADVGCGAGVALVAMAQAFPRSDFRGFDNSRIALGRAAENKARAGVENLHFHDTTHQRLEEDQSYDFITTFDCIHDMTHPVETIGAIYRSLKPDGTWFVSDIHGHPTFEENLSEQPLSGMFYGFSVLCCMRSALSTEDGAGLGTLGFTETVARAVAEKAGFTRFQKHDLEHPMNDFYEVRP